VVREGDEMNTISDEDMEIMHDLIATIHLDYNRMAAYHGQ